MAQAEAIRGSADIYSTPEKHLDLKHLDLLDFLKELQGEVEKTQSYELGGTPGIDYTRAIRALQYLHGRGEIQASSQFCDVLFHEGVEPAHIRIACERAGIVFPEGYDVDSYIQERFFGPNTVEQANLNVKSDKTERVGGGKQWLKDFAKDRWPHGEIDLETAHRINKLAKSASAHYGPSAAAVTRLMFMCGVNGQQLFLMINARIAEAPMQKARAAEARSLGLREPPDFFKQMQDFFGIYADITTKVKRNAKLDQKSAIEDRARSALTRFLNVEEFQVAQLKAGGASPEPFSVFGNMLRGEKNINPWVLGEGTGTPFDVSKFDLVFTPEVPRGLIADAAFFLNNYDEALFIQTVHRLLSSAEEYVEKRRARKESPVLSKQLSNKIQETVSEILKLREGTHQMPDDPQRQHQILVDFAARQSRSLSAFAVLLRMTDPEKVVKTTQIKQDFNTLVSEMPSFRLSSENPDDNIKKIPIFGNTVWMFLQSQNKYLDVPLLGIEGNPSIRKMLVTKSEEKWFDEEVLTRGPFVYSKHPHKPPDRQLITPRDLLGLTPEERRRAELNFNSAKGAEWTVERKWIKDAGAAMALLPNNYKNILQYSRNEADIQWNNPGEYVTAFYPSASHAMKDIVASLCPEVTDKDYIIGTYQEYDTMSAPFVDKGAQFFAVHCNQRATDTEPARAKTPREILDEIAVIVEREKNLRGGRMPLALLVSSKTRLGDAVGVAPIEEKIRVKRDKETGETIEQKIRVGERTPNAFGLAQIFTEFREKYGSRSFMDDSQTVERNDNGQDLSKEKPDVMIASCGKAPGVKNIAVAMIRKTPEEELSAEPSANINEPIARDYDDAFIEYAEDLRLKDDEKLAAARNEQLFWREMWRDPLSKLTPERGTIELGDIAAAGISLQHHNSRIDTWGLRRGLSDRRTQRQIIAEHHAELTAHVIDKAKEYPLQLLRYLQSSNFPISVGDVTRLVDDPAIRKQLGCEIVYPVHRKAIDYTFATVAFPNLGGVEWKQVVLRGGTKNVPFRSNYLIRSLERQGFPPGCGGEQCMLGGNGFRISFDTLQNKEHVDRLFQAIIVVHAEFLRREVEKSRDRDAAGYDSSKEVFTFADLLTYTPNVAPESWIED